MTPQEKVRGRYRKKPVEVEALQAVQAVQWTGKNFDDVLALCADERVVKTPDGLCLDRNLWAHRGEWIVREGDALRVFKPHGFEATYEPVDQDGGEEQVGAGHRVVIEFDGGMPGLKLLHPEGGCTAPIQCGLCAADLTDPKAKRCYDCKDMAAEGCWLEGWFDNLDYDELLHGKVTLPIDATWDGDHPVVTVLQPPASTQQAVPSTPEKLDQNTPCPNCRHVLARHTEDGCLDCECVSWIPTSESKGASR